MHLDKTISEFYTEILGYAGLTLEDETIVNVNPKLKGFTLNGKAVALPYMELLKDKSEEYSFFHLLNESYSSPETAMFSLYRNRLTLELNLRMGSLVTSLIALASDPMLQQRVNDPDLLKVLTDIGEADLSIVEGFLSMSKASNKENNEAYLVDIFIKKNGEVKGVPYSAIGKLNFRLYEEVKRALTDASKEYRVFGTKVRKKDLLVVSNVFRAIFEEIDTPNFYTVGTDNQLFRYLETLLRTAKIATGRMDQLAESMLKINEPSLLAEDIISGCGWEPLIPKLETMKAVIRLIPDQNDPAVEAKVIADKKAALARTAPPRFDPSAVAQTEVAPVQPQVQYNQQAAQPQQVTQPQQVQQPQQVTQPRPEDIIKNNMNLGINPNTMPNMMMANPVLQQQLMMQQGMMANAQNPMMNQPAWIRNELMNNQAGGVPQVDPRMAMLQQQQLLAQQMQAQQLQAQQLQAQQLQAQQLANMQNPMMNQMSQLNQMNQMNMGQGLNLPFNPPYQPQGNMQLNPAFMRPAGFSG